MQKIGRIINDIKWMGSDAMVRETEISGNSIQLEGEAVRTVNALIFQAVQARASDIHLEAAG